MGKTVENGCTEQEAMAALNKARAMMDAYEVTDADIAEAKSEGAKIETMRERDPHRAREFLSPAIARFAGCEVWRTSERKGLSFCGLPSDIELATFLVDTLSNFVSAQLLNYLLPLGRLDRKVRRQHVNGFVIACANRIAQRLNALAAEARPAAAGRALIVVKNQLITEAMAKAGIRLGGSRQRSFAAAAAAVAAGRAAGDRASFARPVGAGGPLRLGAA